jgi:tetratricopeptide (TPR) repeat protein
MTNITGANVQSQSASIEAARRAFGAGDTASAERICTQILAGNATDWAAWALLAETAMLRGRLDAAAVCADRAIAAAPQNPLALVLRAKCLFRAGEPRRAFEATEAASRYAGDSSDALDAIGAMFGLLGRHARARDLFLRAVAQRPDVTQYLFNLAATERMTGALVEAEQHCGAAIVRDRHYGLAHYLRSDLRTQTADRNHIGEMEALIDEGKLSIASRIMLHFALGKECEDLERYDRAFHHVQAGCALQHRITAGDVAVGLAEIDRIIGTHGRSWLESAPAGYAGAAPIYVAGLPRTGTTLVERIIASHPDIHSVGETSAFAAEMQRALAEDARPAPARVGQRYLEQVAALSAEPGKRFVDKTLENYLYCGLIHAALPKARIILVERHPLDTCWAIYKAHFQGKFPFAYHQIELADTYLAYRRLVQHWVATLPSHALMVVRYEDIVQNQSAASRRMIDFVGLPWDDEVLRFHQSRTPSATASAVQVRRPIYATSIGQWRHYAAQLAPLRERLGRDIPATELAETFDR